jgi:hypothetical protein
VKVLNLPGLSRGGDVSDWLGAGGDAEELARLAQEAPAWEPPNAEIQSDHPKGSGFGQNESLPLKTPREIVEAAKDGTDWIVEGLLAPGEITDLAGLAKHSGKTTLITHMLAAVIGGEKFIGLTTREARVLYLTEQGNNFANALIKSGLADAGGALRIVQYRDLAGDSSRWANLIEAATRCASGTGSRCWSSTPSRGCRGSGAPRRTTLGISWRRCPP